MKAKLRHTAFSLLFLLFLIPESKAQFLKKLQKRVEKKVENVIVDKTSNKAAEKTSNSMDKVFDISTIQKEKVNPATIAGSYNFTWKYSLKITSREGEMGFDYYLKPDAPYFGFSAAAMENMFTVMDNTNKVSVIFMQSEGNNIGMATKLPEDFDASENDDQKFKFETLPNKVINGFNCKGVKSYNSTYEMIMYFTNETEVGFNDMFKSSKAKIPAELKNYFNEKDKMLVIFMESKNLKNKKENVKMECVGLEKTQKTIKKADYKFM